MSWLFFQTDPFKRKKKLSKTEHDNCINQTVPTLRWVLDAAQSSGKNIMFDIKRTSQCEGHPYEGKFEETILNTIHASGIDPEKVRNCFNLLQRLSYWNDWQYFKFSFHWEYLFVN